MAKLFVILIIAFISFVLITFLNRIRKRFVDLINKVADIAFDNSLSALIKFVFYFILFQIATLKGRQKLLSLLIKLHKHKLVKYKKKEIFFIELTIILIDIIGKMTRKRKGMVAVSEPLLLYPANHSKIYR